MQPDAPARRTPVGTCLDTEAGQDAASAIKSAVMASGLERARQHLHELKHTLQTSASASTDADQQHLVQRLLSHYEAGPSGLEAQPAAGQLRAQMCSLGLLARNVQLPHSLLKSAGIRNHTAKVKRHTLHHGHLDYVEITYIPSLTTRRLTSNLGANSVDIRVGRR